MLAPFRELLEDRCEWVIARFGEEIKQAGPSYAQMPPDLRQQVAEAFVEHLRRSVLESEPQILVEFINQVGHQHAEKGFLLDETQEVALIIRTLLLDLVREVATRDAQAGLVSMEFVDDVVNEMLRRVNGIFEERLVQREKELEVLSTISRGLTSGLNIEKLMREVLALATASVGASDGSLFIFDQQGEVSWYILIRQDLSPVEAQRVIDKVLERGMAGWARQHKQGLIVSDICQDDRWIIFPDDDVQQGSAISVPFFRDNTVVGLLTLVHPQTHHFTVDHLILLTTIAGQVATAIENARLYQQTDEALRRRVQELSLLLDVSLAMTSSLDLEQVLDVIMAEASTVLGAEAGSVLLLDEESGELVFEVSVGAGAEVLKGRRMSAGEGVAGWVAQEGQPVLVPDVNQDTRFYRGVDSLTEITTRSLLCAPLRARDKIIGAVELINKTEGTFNSSDLTLLDALARSAAIAIENARLYTATLKLTQRLLESEEKYRTLVENAQDAIVRKAIGEDGKGPWLFVNRAMEEISGYPLKRFYTDPQFIYQIIHAEDRSQVRDKEGKIARGEVSSFRYRIIHRDGSERWIWQTGYPVKDAEGRIVATEGIARDITETKKMEDQLIQAAKLAATGKLAASIAHEVNNPLQAIRSCLEMVGLKTGPQHTAWPYLDVAQKELARVAEVVKRLVDTYRPAKEGLGPTDVNALLEEVLKLMERQFSTRGVVVEKRLSPERPVLMGVPNQLQQVFLNIALNALEAMPQGGRLWVATEFTFVDRQGHKQENEKRHPTHLLVSFQDTGKGIAATDLKRVFEPLFTTKSKGTGLGLTVSQAIVHRHRGTIDIESAEGLGTTVFIKLPLGTRGSTS